MAEQHKLTLEQQRAADAWKCAQNCNSDYVNLAKGLPALIMNSGLIQVLAFLNEKGENGNNPQHKILGPQLRQWLAHRFQEKLPKSDFDTVIPALMTADPQLFQDITAEAMAWLRWLRQIAPARCIKKDGEE